MVPIDFTIYGECSRRKMVYTRYADDIYISAEENVGRELPMSIITEACKKFNAPYECKAAKTRYCTKSGANFMLGVLLNEQNQVTIGHKKKKWIETACYTSLMYLTGKAALPEDALSGPELNGYISYIHMVEPTYERKLMANMSKKFPGINVRETLKRLP